MGPRCLRTLVVGMAGAAALAVTALVPAAGTAGASVGAGVFDCSTPHDFLSQNPPGATSQEQLWESADESNPTVWSQVGTAVGGYNAMGLSPVDGHIYAISVPSEHLLRIDSTGAVTDLGAIQNLPAAPSYIVGAFDPSGNFWIAVGNSASPNVYEIDVQSSPASATALQTSIPFGAADMTYSNGYMWGQNRGTIWRLDLSTAAVTSFSTTIPFAGQAGAAFTYANGDVGFDDNATSNLYRVSVANPSSPTLVSTSTTAPIASNTNDGTSCGQGADLSISDSAPATVGLNGQISWTLTVSNAGPFVSGDFTVDDPVPAGVTAVTAPGCSVAGNDVTCTGSGLQSGQQATFTVTGTASSGGCSTDTATVSGINYDPNLANNSASARTCVQYGLGGGFLPPVRNPPIVNTGHAGRTYPLKWQLTDANGQYVTSLSVVTSITVAPTQCGSFGSAPTSTDVATATGGTSLRYDTTDNQYVYNWQTQAPGCYTVYVTFDSGQTMAAYFNLS